MSEGERKAEAAVLDRSVTSFPRRSTPPASCPPVPLSVIRLVNKADIADGWMDGWVGRWNVEAGDPRGEGCMSMAAIKYSSSQ